MARKQRKREWRKLRVKVYALFVVFCAASGFGIYHYVNAKSASGTFVGEPLTIDPNFGIKTKVEELFLANDAPEMIDIIRCESHFRHYNDDGSILENQAGSSAIGVAQILASKHPDPKVLKVYNIRNDMDLTIHDFDLTTVEGNLAYALVLYEVRGTQDWECSKKFRFSH